MPRKVGHYEIGKTLGKGNFSKVKYAVDMRDGSTWALKIVDRAAMIKENTEHLLRREIAIMKTLDCPHIVKLREVLQTRYHIYMVLELVTGGEIFDRIVSAKRFEEKTARRYFQQLIYALLYCHLRGVAHRDLKPENLLLDSSDNLKLTDFGLSAFISENGDRISLLQTTCGTPSYVAPEVLSSSGYDGKQADAWSCGVILFVMLSGYLPFEDKHANGLFNKIEQAKYRIPRHVSPEASDVIRSLMEKDPAKRATLGELVASAWFKTGLSGSLLEAFEALLNDKSTTVLPSTIRPSSALVESPSLPDLVGDSPVEDLEDQHLKPVDEQRDKEKTTTEIVVGAEKYEPTQSELDNAFVTVEDAEGIRLPALAHRSSVASVNRPANIFSVATRLIMGSLSPLVAPTNTASSADLIVRKATRYLANGPTSEVIATTLHALHSLGAAVTSNNDEKSFFGSFWQVKAHVTGGALVSFVIMVVPTIHPQLSVVTMCRERGNIMTFHQAFRTVCVAFVSFATVGMF